MIIPRPDTTGGKKPLLSASMAMVNDPPAFGVSSSPSPSAEVSLPPQAPAMSMDSTTATGAQR